MTKDELISAGADYAGGLELCMNNEEFYFKMIRKGLVNEKFDSLKKIWITKILMRHLKMHMLLKVLQGIFTLHRFIKP